jgi:hypothetical protein
MIQPYMQEDVQIKDDADEDSDSGPDEDEIRAATNV